MNEQKNQARPAQSDLRTRVIASTTPGQICLLGANLARDLTIADPA